MAVQPFWVKTQTIHKCVGPHPAECAIRCVGLGVVLGLLRIQFRPKCLKTAVDLDKRLVRMNREARHSQYTVIVLQGQSTFLQVLRFQKGSDRIDETEVIRPGRIGIATLQKLLKHRGCRHFIACKCLGAHINFGTEPAGNLGNLVILSRDNDPIKQAGIQAGGNGVAQKGPTIEIGNVLARNTL